MYLNQTRAFYKYQSLQTRESSEVWGFNKALGITEIEDFQLVKNLSKKIENKIQIFQ